MVAFILFLIFLALCDVVSHLHTIAQSFKKQKNGLKKEIQAIIEINSATKMWHGVVVTDEMRGFAKQLADDINRLFK